MAIRVGIDSATVIRHRAIQNEFEPQSSQFSLLEKYFVQGVGLGLYLEVEADLRRFFRTAPCRTPEVNNGAAGET